MFWVELIQQIGMQKAHLLGVGRRAFHGISPCCFVQFFARFYLFLDDMIPFLFSIYHYYQWLGGISGLTIYPGLSRKQRILPFGLNRLHSDSMPAKWSEPMALLRYGPLPESWQEPPG